MFDIATSGIGVLWLFTASHVAGASKSLRGYKDTDSEKLLYCPVLYNPPTNEGETSKLSLPSVRTFTEDYLDTWWTEQKTTHFRFPADPGLRASLVEEGGNYKQDANKTAPYNIERSRISGCGIFASRKIFKGQKIDMVWAPDDTTWLPAFLQDVCIHVTPWFGYGMNHCSKDDKANVHVEVLHDPSRAGWGVASRDIPSGEELLINYNKIFMQYPFRIFPANPFWDC